jgi:cbb3-type cytochrome oxidase subunit 3
MRALASEFFARSPVMSGPLLAIALFFTVFVGVALWVMWTKREAFDALARMPLDENEKEQEVRRG